MAKLKYCVYCGAKLEKAHDDDEEMITLRCSKGRHHFTWNDEF